jgi:DNA polymerase-1
MGRGKGLVINSADQLHKDWPNLVDCDVLALSQPLGLPDGTVILAAYSDQQEVQHQPTEIHLPKRELIECLHGNSLSGGALLIVHGLDAWLRFFSDSQGILVDCPALRCTRLLAYLLDPPEKAEDESDVDLTLEALVRRYLELPYPSWGVWLQGKHYPEALYRRLWEDARLTYQLWHKFTAEIYADEDKEFLALYNNVELPMVRILVDMELQGVHVDKVGAAQRLREINSELIPLQQQITQLVGSWVNPNSPLQVRPFFSWFLQQPYMGPINDEAFEDLSAKHPALHLMLRFRKLSRDWSFLTMAADTETGRVHSRHHQCRIATGRISCTNPPLQNIRKEIREQYVLPAPGHLLVEADYKQAEARLLAYYSRDEKLQEIFSDESKDVFEETAAHFNRLFTEYDVKLSRDDAKTLFYSITYGASGEKVESALGIDPEIANTIVYIFKENLYPGVGRMIERVREHLVEFGRKGRYVETPWGRRRMFDRRLISLYDPKTPLQKKDPVRDPEVRKAFNFLLQGTVADMIKQVQVQLDRFLKKRGMQSRVILNLHDGLYLSVPPDEYPTVEQLVRETMESDRFMEKLQEFAHTDAKIPLRAEIKILREDAND